MADAFRMIKERLQGCKDLCKFENPCQTRRYAYKLVQKVIAVSLARPALVFLILSTCDNMGCEGVC